MNYTTSFAASVEDFLSETKMNPTQFGKDAVGDPNFVRDIRRGRAPSARTMDRVATFMAKHRKAEEAA